MKPRRGRRRRAAEKPAPAKPDGTPNRRAPPRACRRRPAPSRHRRLLRHACSCARPAARWSCSPSGAPAGRRRVFPAPDAEERRLHAPRARRADRLAGPNLLLRRVGRLRAAAGRRRRTPTPSPPARFPRPTTTSPSRPPAIASSSRRGSSTPRSRSRTGPRTPTPTSSSARWSRVRWACRATRKSASMVHGLLGDGVFYYSAGVFNGDGPDFRNVDNQPDAIGRVALSPFARGEGAFRRLALGGSGWYGRHVAGADVSRPGDARRPAIPRAAVDDRPAAAHARAARARHR